MVKFVFLLFFFFFLPTLSYFFIYYFSLNSQKSTHVHKSQVISPLFFFLSFFPPQFSPPHIHTPPPHHTFHTYTLYFLVSLNILLFYRSHIHWVCSFIFYFYFFPTHVHEPKFAAEFLFFFLRCHWGLLIIFAEFVEK